MFVMALFSPSCNFPGVLVVSLLSGLSCKLLSSPFSLLSVSPIELCFRRTRHGFAEYLLALEALRSPLFFVLFRPPLVFNISSFVELLLSPNDSSRLECAHSVDCLLWQFTKVSFVRPFCILLGLHLSLPSLVTTDRIGLRRRVPAFAGSR